MASTPRVLSTFLLLVGVSAIVQLSDASVPFLQPISLSLRQRQPQSVKVALELRGGASKSKKRKSGKSASLSSTAAKTATGKKKVQAAAKHAEKKAAGNDIWKQYKNIPLTTRCYLTVMALATLSGPLLGEELSQGLLAMDPIRVLYGFEVWRPLTAASFLGPPNISWLTSGYYVYQYGSSLEQAYGSAQFLIFFMSQIVLLSILSGMFGLPFYAKSVTTAMLHMLSRAMPKQKTKLLVISIPQWMLPYGLMAIDVLQSGNPAAALVHILGIFSGHFYYFHKFVWPKMENGGEDWLEAPDFLVRLLQPQDAKTEAVKDKLDQALKKSKKRGKGRKLGSK